MTPWSIFISRNYRMNHRLLTEADKQEIRRARHRRDGQRQARRRRSALLSNLAVAVGIDLAAVAGLVPSPDSLDLLTSHLTHAKAVAKSMKRALKPYTTPGAQAEHPCALDFAPRPQRTLLPSRRSSVRPWLVEEGEPEKGQTLQMCLDSAREAVATGVPAASLLDCFACASQLPIEAAAMILHRGGLVESEFPAHIIASVRSARHFWQRYAEGRRAAQGAILDGEIAANAGDWALLNHRSLMALLSGLVLPKNLRRPEYLANLLRTAPAWSLDIYSFPSKLPLVRHPFEPNLTSPKTEFADG